MSNRTRHVGQRVGHGLIFGSPHLPAWMPRAKKTSSTTEKLDQYGWIDRIGMPRGRSGDKLARKAFVGTIGVRHRGQFFAWASSKAATSHSIDQRKKQLRGVSESTKIKR